MTNQPIRAVASLQARKWISWSSSKWWANRLLMTTSGGSPGRLRALAVIQRIGWFVNDLHRNAFSYYGFGLLARLMRWHRFVIHDGPVSIARAFGANDWRDLLREAGLPKGAAEVTWRFPFRLCVERVKP